MLLLTWADQSEVSLDMSRSRVTFLLTWMRGVSVDMGRSEMRFLLTLARGVSVDMGRTE